MANLEEVVQSKSPRFFFMVGVLAAAGIYYGQPPMDYENLISKAKNDISVAQEKLRLTQERTQNKDKYQKEMEVLSETFRQVLEYLPKQLDTQDLLKKIYSEARAAGVEFSNFKPRDSVAKDFYDELPMDIQVKGAFSQLLNFMSNIGKIPRIINIRNVELGSPTMLDGYPVLTLKGTLVGYRYKEGK